MLIPLKHEQMTARRWPVITFALIALNVVAFLGTHYSMEDQSAQLAEAKSHLLIMAAMHPNLEVPPDVQKFIDNFKESNPETWKTLQNPSHELYDAWDARMRLIDSPLQLQAEMDTVVSQYKQFSSSSVLDQYALIPANPRPVAYLTSMFLHGGWLHIIGNMWFLWLAGFVLEDAWGRPVYAIFYLLGGIAATQFYIWTNPTSIVPTLGASGAVAALMGAFLMRFPKLKIEMAWVLWLGFRPRMYRFKMAAYWLLPLWLLMEVFYGSLSGNSGGVAHWAHVGGFVFGAMAALGLRFSGIEHKMNKAIEEDITLTAHPELTQAGELIEQNRTDEGIDLLKKHLEANPDSVDACMLLSQAYWRAGKIPEYVQIGPKLCALHLKAKAPEAAWQDYEDYLNAGGKSMPVATWLDLCRVAAGQGSHERALQEYEKLIAAYPAEKQTIAAQVAAARICLKQINRPDLSLKFFEAANASPIPHLDWDQAIQAGMREAKAAIAGPKTAATTA